MNSLKFIDDEIFATKCEITVTNIELERTDTIIRKSLDKLNRLNKKLQTLQQIKTELDVLQILTKCIRVSTISYDDSDVSKTSYDYSLETDELTIEEFNTLDNYYKALEIEDE